ncbi:MAG: hypothetical protein KBT34_11325 [Prevotella sp.]|nr:hypothetical protein [Candidatus Prevotella equi]
MTNSALAREMGVWTHYNAYNDVKIVVPTSDGVFALSGEGLLYSYKPSDETFTEFNTSTYLNDYNSITDIVYNSATRRMLICYDNTRLDILSTKDNSSVNISAIANETTMNKKTIINVFSHGKNAYVVMPWGIIIINMERQEILDTYRLDTDKETISDVFVEGDMMYVSTSAPLEPYGTTMICGDTKKNLIDKDNWQAVDADKQTEILSKMKAIKQQRNIYTTGTEKKNADLISDKVNNCYWGSDDDNNLVRYKKEDGAYVAVSKALKPYGPSSNKFYKIRWQNNNLYTVSEGFIAFEYIPDKAAVVQMLNSDGKWCTFEKPMCKHPYTHTFNLSNDIVVDPRDTAHVFVAANEGLYEYLSGKFVKHYNSDNSLIPGFKDNSNSKNYQMILGMAYDKNNTLWVLNSYCSRGLMSLKQASPRDTTAAGNVWNYYKHKELDVYSPAERYLSHAFFAKDGKMWFLNGHGLETSFYRYDPWLDELITFEPKHNQDNAPLYSGDDYQFLRDIAEDKEGNIWITGNRGLEYLPKDMQNAPSKVIYQYKVNRDDGTGLADYLFPVIDASCVLFDSANRMYLSTIGNGIYIVSADKKTELAHYTADNSPLKSNKVYYMQLDEKTGTLYISTDKGLCSVVTDATEVPESLNKENIKVYPNPVKPEYTGDVMIEGLTVGADIKITTATGVVVHEGKSTSGIYRWDACDRWGERCSTGVYNILLVSATGEESTVAKVAIVK